MRELLNSSERGRRLKMDTCISMRNMGLRSCYNGSDWPLITDIPESVYGLPADQLKSTIGADSTPAMTGSAVVAVTQGDGAPSFTLQSISYDN